MNMLDYEYVLIMSATTVCVNLSTLLLFHVKKVICKGKLKYEWSITHHHIFSF